jgi:hypothetical protein
MISRIPASAKTANTQLRDRIISAYQRAQRTIAVAPASPVTNTHAAMAAYDDTEDMPRRVDLRSSPRGGAAVNGMHNAS